MKNIIITILVCIVAFLGFIFLSFKPVGIIENDGYAISGNKVSEFLFKEKSNKKEKNIKATKVHAFDYLYSSHGKLFLGETKKTSINPIFPIFTNQNLALVSLSDDTILIDSNFKKYEGYKNFTLTSGELYNVDDKIRADENNYLFLKLANSLIMNSTNIKISTLTNNYEIKTNSIIYFNETYIKYYSLSSDLLVYNEILDLDFDAKVSILDKTYTYEELLINLKLYNPSKTEVPDIKAPGEEKKEPLTVKNTEVPYQVPKVNCDDFITNVYSSYSKLHISDPSGAITSPIIFEVKANNKTYLRKAYISSGMFEIIGLSPSTTFEIIGYYNYINEKGVELEKTFFKQTIETKDFSSLSPLTVSFENGDIYSTKIEVKNLKITKGLDSENIKGIKKVIVKINDKPFNLNAKELNNFLTGKDFTYQSPENIESNQMIDYEIIITDSFGNQFTVLNNKGTTRTSKRIPTALLNVVQKDISQVNIKATMENIDDVALGNYRYVVTTSDNKVVFEELVPNSNLIELENLDSNELYSISLYADLDINDGKGTYKNELIAETKFTSVPITSLGYVRLNLELVDLHQTTADVSISLDTISTNSKLIELLKRIKVNVIELDDNKEKVVYSFYLSTTNLAKLKANQSVIEQFIGLKSSSTYYIKIDSVVSQGDKDYNLETLTNLKSFTTLKKEANIAIINSFSTESIIDFDVKVIDEDNAVLSNNIRLEVRDVLNKIIRIEKINLNDDFVRLTFDKLKLNNYYTFNYIAEEYNVGKDNTTFLENHIVASYKVFTEIGINGDISITSLLEKKAGKNLFNINNNLNWKSLGVGIDEKFIDVAKDEITLTALNGYQNSSYYLIDYIGKTLTVSFYAKRVEGEAPVYVTNSDGNSSTYLLANLTNEYKKYTYTYTLNNGGYTGFNIREVEGKNNRTTVMLKNLQIEQSNVATDYEPFVQSSTYDALINVNLNDTRNEIVTNDYYIKIYKEANLVSSIQYDIDDTNQVINKETLHSLNRNTNYRLDLVVKIREREYVIASTEFTTEKEIRSIRNITDFFRMHNNGRYIVTADLDFTKSSSVYSSPFYGEIDFQGHQVIMSVQGNPSYLFYIIRSTGKIKNIDFHIYLNNTDSRAWYYGLNYRNYGTIENIMVTIEEAKNVGNVAFVTTSCENFGNISNFVVNSKVSISGERYFSPFVLCNHGTLENGYVYGEDINATFSNETPDRKRVGSLAAYTGSNSQIRNVFSLININSYTEGGANNKQIGLIVGESNRGLIQNVYSVGKLNIANTTGDINIGYVSNSVNPSNLYYLSDEIYNTNYSQKISNIAVNDREFQNKVLNEADAFIVDENISNGYYPQVKWPKCMPYQELIPLPEVKDSDLMDIISTEVIENNFDTAKIVFDVHNPSLEVISDISIKDLNVEILKQETSKGKTKVTVKVKNVDKYLSKYYVKSITSKSAYNIYYTRTYKDNEKVLNFDLYRKVSTIEDWKNIKDNPNENYQLTADLDFQSKTGFLVGNFSGKLNGDNHTIKNIEITEGSGLFNTLTGEIKNLNVVNYKKTNPSAYGGLIYNSKGVSTIDNVHMTDVSINATSYIGGIIGYGEGTIIKNSSVTNFKNNNAEGAIDIRIGSLAGYISGGYILNSYAQGINIDIANSISTYGVGGLVGQLSSGLAENCYAVGNIKTNSSMAGGIVGLSSANISNVYSDVNIESKLDYIGGIIGQATNNYLYNSLVVGNLYSSYITTYMHRTVGNKAPNQNNYALSSQLINGYESSHFYGENLIFYDELLSKPTYEAVIKLGPYFNYEMVPSGYLPKLYNTDGITLLPNQTNNQISQQQFSIVSVDSIKGMEDATIFITLNNPNNFEIIDIEFDYFKILNTKKISTEDGKTTIEVIVEPEKALDTYMLNKIIYKEADTIKEFNKSVKIDLQFYKNLGSFEDWQKIDSEVPENYRLVDDIDFNNHVNIKTNVVIARLEGMDDGYKIKNLTINKNLSSQSLIRIITTNLENITFDNINITNTRTSGSYNNIITFSYADIKNVHFSNITIDAPKMSYAAPIGISRGYFVANITVDNVNVKGADYSSGFIGSALINGYNDITGSNITVEGKKYTGGLIAYKPYNEGTRYFTFNVDNVNIKGTSYVGGIFGMGTSDNSSVKNATVTGTSYVGGFSGHAYTYKTTNVTVRDSEISGTGSYIGGVYGLAQYYHYNTYLFDSTVTGLLASTNYVGGLMGHSGRYDMYNSGVSNSTIISNGNYVGGITGYNEKTIQYSFVQNTSVKGLNYVGGVVGISRTGNTSYINVNADVVATGINAGGVSGYVKNTHSTNASYPIRAHHIIVAGGSVTAQSNVGGVSGYVEVELYEGHFYSNLVATTLNTTNPDGAVSPAIGNNKDYNSKINNLVIYENMPVNDQTAGTMPDNGLTSDNLVTLENLKVQSTYTNKGFATGRYDYKPLANDKFPLVKTSAGAVDSNQVATPLPTEILRSMLRLRTFEVRKLPTVNVYSIDVDKINIEFDKEDSFSAFTIKYDNKILGPYAINQRTFTFSYDFKTDFEIEINDNINQKKENISAKELRKLISVYDDKYYYYKEHKIKGNDVDISGDFINIYSNKALDKDGNIFTLPDLKNIGNVSSLDLDNKVVPMYEFIYSDYKIKTFYNYSVITDKDNMSTSYEDQYLVKNGKLEIISSILNSKKESIIIDSYSKKEYQTVLGSNGVIYNLKEPIKVPNDFINENIKYFTNNLTHNSSFVLVYYEDGSIYGFDYRTGKKIFTEKVKLDLSLFEYIKQKLTKTEDVIDDNTISAYHDIKNIEEKLKADPIENALSNDNSSKTNKEKNYIAKYDPITKNFILYDEDILSNNEPSVISEVDKIISNSDLIQYYSNKKFPMLHSKVNGLQILFIILGGIGISLLLYFKIIKNFKSQNDY